MLSDREHDWDEPAPDNHIKHMRYLAECASAAGFPSTEAFWRARIADAERQLAEEPYSAWENYRPDDLTDDELAEYVIQSKGI